MGASCLRCGGDVCGGGGGRRGVGGHGVWCVGWDAGYDR